jgi:hypothetical protein
MKQLFDFRILLYLRDEATLSLLYVIFKTMISQHYSTSSVTEIQ